MKTMNNLLVMKMVLLAMLAGCDDNFDVAPSVDILSWTDVLDKGIEGCMDHYRVPGCAWAVMHGDSIVHSAAHGVIAVGSEQPVVLTSHFQVGSLGKSFTSLIAAGCVESGLLDWHTRLFDVIPEWKENARPEYDDLNLADLLSHRTRLQPLNAHSTHVDKKTNTIVYEDMPNFKGTEIERRQQYCRYALSLEPVAPVELNYGNSGYSIAASMLEAVTGKTWEELALETAENLEMEVGFERPNKLDALQPWGHLYSGYNSVEPVSPDDMRVYNDPIAAPAGNLHVDVRDFTNYLSVFMKGLAGENSIVSAGTARFLLGGIDGYAFGWYNSHDGDEIYYHYGSEGTFYCHMMIFANLDAAIVIFTNAPGIQNSEYFLNDARNFLKQKYIYEAM